MFVTVSAILCHLIAGQPVCVDEIVTDTNMEPALTWQGCTALGQAPIAKWKSEHPIYSKPDWYIEKYRCTPGRYEPAGRA
jgi:hypothetical protein